MIEISGKEFGEFPDTPQGISALRDRVEFYLKSIRNQQVYCNALNAYITFRRRGIKKTLSFSGDPRKLKALIAIKAIIQTAHLMDIQKNDKSENKPQSLAYFHLKQCVKIGQVIYDFRVIIEQDHQGKLFYDLNVLEESTKKPKYEHKLENKSKGQHLGYSVLDSTDSCHSIRLWYRNQCHNLEKKTEFMNYFLDEVEATTKREDVNSKIHRLFSYFGWY